MLIEKSHGTTPTEKIVAHLCEKTFFNIWSYPNTFKFKRHELADVLVIFDNHVFIFEVTEKSFNEEKELLVAWKNWKKDAIDKKIKQLIDREDWILENRNKIYLNSKCKDLLPIDLSDKELIFHKILVVYGAEEACKKIYPDNIHGSLSITYCNEPSATNQNPFYIALNNQECIHVFNGNSFEILLNELDTMYDFIAYILAKEAAVKRYGVVSYCGEENLLAYFWQNIDQATGHYDIGKKEDDAKCGLLLYENTWWQNLVKSFEYKLRKKKNRISYQFWDKWIHDMSEALFQNTYEGHTEIFNSKCPIYEMAKEPRSERRRLCEIITKEMKNFSLNESLIAFNPILLLSFYDEKLYILFLSRYNGKGSYEQYREYRKLLLFVSCLHAKQKSSSKKKIIGIAIDSTDSIKYSYDFLLINKDSEILEETRKNSEFQKFYDLTTKNFPLNVSYLENQNFKYVLGDVIQI